MFMHKIRSVLGHVSPIDPLKLMPLGSIHRSHNVVQSVTEKNHTLRANEVMVGVSLQDIYTEISSAVEQKRSQCAPN